ncbi:hypothetical protein Tsubulata_043797, partial [Turnera subulata]
MSQHDPLAHLCKFLCTKSILSLNKGFFTAMFYYVPYISSLVGGFVL